MEPDFSGYATRNELKCSDGKTIKGGAFKHNDKMRVPLVWMHQHNEVENVLGYAMLEHREDGVYARGFFNETDKAKHMKESVRHGDVTMMSIYANQLKQRDNNVLHGNIREVSLVLSGANPGALIDNVYIRHGDENVEMLDDEAIIYTGLTLEHADNQGDNMATDTKDNKAPAEDKTVQDVFETLSDEQKDVVYFMIGEALDKADNGDLAQSEAPVIDTDALEETITHAMQKGFESMPRNVFEKTADKSSEGATLSHDDMKAITADAQSNGSFKEAFLSHAESLGYGIDDIDILFPDARTLTSSPEFISRRMEWVQSVLNGARHSPFSRIKSIVADITAEEARAKGYVKGNLKKNEIIKLLKRVTTPTTIYKKQKLDRDDIVDIVDLDVVSWLKSEMRLMLDEELARAILIGDGREPDDEDKVNEDHIRPIAFDNDMYTHQVTVQANIAGDAIVEAVLRARTHYKGTGAPTFYTTDTILTDLILIKDKIGRRLYNTEAELAAALRVDKIVVVEVMETVPDVLGIIVNMADYTIGADKGGQLAMFDDFDIDYNQQKYLLEVRASGALTKPKSAVVVKRTSGTTVSPDVPAYNAATKTITIPTKTGVQYMIDDEVVTGNVVITETTDVEAVPTTGYNFPHNTDADWTYAYSA